MYKREFSEALNRTHKFGLHIPTQIPYKNGRFLNDKVQEELPFIIRDSIGVLEEDEIVLQCLLLNFRLKKLFAEYFNCPIYYTIGYVGVDDHYMFKQTESSLFSMLENRSAVTSISLHAWLTLPSMEILDFSFATSYARVNGIKEMMGRALAMHPSDLTGGMTYHPMIIGEEFLFKIGAIKISIDPNT